MLDWKGVVLREEALRRAMLASDVSSLDRLLADDFVFVDHFGRKVTKQDDLEAHRQKVFQLHQLDIVAQDKRVVGGNVVTVSEVVLAGVADGESFTDRLVYTRIWRKDAENGWQVTSGQCTRIQ
ncbi:nuclear transport factor 2 family protein [Listeria cornellensis]|uniref:Cytochrome p-450:nadph-p-450 reductase n=1 Tax=Listeria cornellensis FSL F6-0969 TaxID=1265820 RepID=W7C5T9_9LIST|nr:nuclear transport factor 2 family protein [Listeria cornellensis]EUJ31041.1 cytochrome p-450:nadph-p-450 reductase [Listeria cornellensis FSL F6-0969]